MATIEEYAIRAEERMTTVAAYTLQPYTYGLLLALITTPGEGNIDQRLVGRILDRVWERNTLPWSRHLGAYVVNAETGVPGPGWTDYYAAGLTPEQHRRLAYQMVTNGDGEQK